MITRAIYSRGFSLVEAMIVIVIMAIMTILGMPSLIEWMQNSQIRTASESILNGLQAARTEAVRRNTNVSFDLIDPGTAGKTGWQLTDVNAAAVIQSKPAGEGSQKAVVTRTPNDSDSYTFTGFGRQPPTGLNADGSAVLTQIDITSGATPPSGVSWRNLRIIITSGGDTRLCDPNIAVSSDPRAC